MEPPAHVRESEMRGSVLASALLITGLTSAMPAVAGDANAQGAGTTSAEPAKPEKVVCRREATVGSHFRKSVCMTRSEWKAFDRNQLDAKERLLDRGYNRPTEPIIKESGG